MTSSETPQEVAERIVREIRAVAPQLSYVERAGLLHAAASEVRTALREDETSRDVNPSQGREWELEGLDPISDAAEKAHSRAVQEQQATQQR